MKKNMGTADRIIRLAIGIIIIVLGFYYRSWFSLIAIIPLLTAATSWCPLYIPFGINTGANHKN